MQNEYPVPENGRLELVRKLSAILTRLEIQMPIYKTNRACFNHRIRLSTPFYARIEFVKKQPFYKTNASGLNTKMSGFKRACGYSFLAQSTALRKI